MCTLLGVAYLVEGNGIKADLQPIHGVTNLWMFLMALSVIGTILALAIQEKEQLENSPSPAARYCRSFTRAPSSMK